MSRRLIFLFYSDGSAPPDRIPAFDLEAVSTNKYANQFRTDGLYYVFEQLLNDGVLDEVLVVTESTRSPGHVPTGRDDLRSIVIPHITCLTHHLEENDLIFTRGGFRSWHDWLVDRQNEGRWAWLYAANTGRQRWPWWDLIMEDISWERMGTADRRGRQYWDYRKPINPDYFFAPEKDSGFQYDFMIGASYITDKKGQWKVIQALRRYKEIFGVTPRCVMPGAVRRGTKTVKMLQALEKDDLGVVMPGFVDRKELGELMRQTKIFIAAGASGQNDRGPLEALACGCTLIINSPGHHHPILSGAAAPSLLIDCHDAAELTHAMSDAMGLPTHEVEKDRYDAIEFFDRTHGMNRVVIPDFKKILGFFEKYPKRSQEAKEAMRHELR